MDKFSVDLILHALSGLASSEEVEEFVSYLKGVKEESSYKAADNIMSALGNINLRIIGNGNIIGDNNRLIYIEKTGARDIADAIWNLRKWYAQTNQSERKKILEDELLSYILKVGAHPEFSQWGKEKYFNLLLRQDTAISKDRLTFAIRNPNDNFDSTVAEPHTIQDTISKFRQLILIGRPGSGKTTALKSLVLNYANSFLQKNNPTKVIPIFIWLPSFRNIQASTPLERFMGVTRASLQRFGVNLSDQELYELIKQGRILLLLDGLNEIGDTYVESLLEGLEIFLDNYPSILMVITSRSYNFRLGKGKLPILEILELEYPDGIKDYLSRYLDDRSSVTRLMGLFVNNLKLRQLAGNPLLLSMIVLVFQNQQGDIPDDRSALLDKISYGLLGQWGQEIDDIGDMFWFEDKHELLQKLGYVMKSEGLELHESRIIEILVETLGKKEFTSFDDRSHPHQFQEITRYNLNQLINELKRNRIFSDIGNTGKIRFWHQALQEYFAAAYVLKDISRFNDLGEKIIHKAGFKKYIADEGWHEILSLVGGLILYSDKTISNKNLFSVYIDEIWRKNKSLAALCLNGKADTPQAFSYVKWLENNIFLWGLYIPRMLPWFLLFTLTTLIWLIPEPDWIIGNANVSSSMILAIIFLGMIVSLLFFRIYVLLLRAYDEFAYRKVIRPGILALRNIANDIAERALLEFNANARYDFAVSNYAKEMVRRDQNLLKRTEHELISLLYDSNFQMQAIEHLGQNNTYESRKSLVNLLRTKFKDLDWLEYNATIHSIVHLSKLRPEWGDNDFSDILINIVQNQKFNLRKRLKAYATLREMNRSVKFPGLFKMLLIRGFGFLLIVVLIVIAILLR